MNGRQIVIGLILGILLILVLEGRISAAPPPRPQQPHPDLFDCGGVTCDHYNPVTQKIRSTKTVTWRYAVVSGCSTNGLTEKAVRTTMTQEAAKVQVSAIEVSSGADMTIYGTCGAAFANVCGGPPVIACLGRGYPYVNDVDISLDMDWWAFDVSRISVVIHEVIGHAWGSANEEYCLGNEPPGNPCYGLPRFAAAPNWPDVMNVGELSRHLLSDVELERWARTMYELAPPTYPYYDPVRGCHDYGYWCFYPSENLWRDPQGVSEWDPPQPDGKQYNRRLQTWFWTHATTWQNTGPDTWLCLEFCF